MRKSGEAFLKNLKVNDPRKHRNLRKVERPDFVVSPIAPSTQATMKNRNHVNNLSNSMNRSSRYRRGNHLGQEGEEKDELNNVKVTNFQSREMM